MPTLYIRTDHVGPYPVCQWKDEPPPQHEDAHWELVAETDDKDLAIRVLEHLKRELRAQRRAGDALRD